MAQKKNYSTVIFGCGNHIMGDDGFGPAVVETLNSTYSLPETAVAIDAGTTVREYLFNYLLTTDDRPDSIIIIDAVDFENKHPGEVFSISTASIPLNKLHDFSLHQFPKVNLLKELEENTEIRVSIMAAQVLFVPDEIMPGLSQPMQKAIPVACEKILQILSVN